MGLEWQHIATLLSTVGVWMLNIFGGLLVFFAINWFRRTETKLAKHSQQFVETGRRIDGIEASIKDLDENKASREDMIGQYAGLRREVRRLGEKISESTR